MYQDSRWIQPSSFLGYQPVIESSAATSRSGPAGALLLCDTLQEIIVTKPGTDFMLAYRKRPDSPNLVLTR
jgi:hypothetical protein